YFSYYLYFSIDTATSLIYTLSLHDALPIWLLDLRDPWALDAWRIYASHWHASRDLAQLRRAITGADFVIANVPEAKRAFEALGADRKSTRLNSSHVKISYAVFCLKKKNN